MAGTTQRRTRGSGDENNNNIAYWMGKVDANLNDLKETIATFLAQNDRRWEAFDNWRRSVDQSLQKGDSKFDDYHKRLEYLEKHCYQAINNKEEKESAKFGTWVWFRDNYLEKAIMIVLSLAFYKIIEVLVTHWATTPTP